MFESLFGFTTRPFAAAPQAARYFPGETIDHARQAIARAIDRAEGPALVVGPIGTGKSLLCQVLADQFADRFRVAVLSSVRLCTRRALLQNILFELGLPYRDMEEDELRLSLMDHLDAGGSRPRSLLLIVDEAHSLPLRLLEELRLLTNLIQDGQPRVRLVLTGGPTLEERFASPKLESFNQRLAVRCYLSPLSRDETSRYIRWQIDSAGVDAGELVTGDALQAAFTATDGIPRLLNQLFDHALFLAATAGKRRLDGDGVQEAWADLQQLPTPWSTAAPTASGSVIEFGELDEDAASLVVVGDEPELEVTDEPYNPRLRIAKPEDDETMIPARPTTRYAAPTTQSEVEVIFNPLDPFGNAFHEEEVVVDRYAALQGKAMAQPVRGSHTDVWSSPPTMAVAPTPPPEAENSPLETVARTPQPAAASAVTTEPEPHEPPLVDAQELLEAAPQVVHADYADLPSSGDVAEEETPDQASQWFTGGAAYAEIPYTDPPRVEVQFNDNTTPFLAAGPSTSPSPPESSEESCEPCFEADIATQIHRLRAVTSDAARGGKRGGAAPPAAPRDDRDLVVVAQREAATKRMDEAIERAGKQAYRQLFAKLRGPNSPRS